MKQHLMSGNEATARGVRGRHQDMLRLSRHPQYRDFREPAPYQKDVYCEWAPNEKVAVEMAYGASIAGSRSFCTMKWWA